LKISDLGFAADMLNSLVPFKANTQLGTKGYAAPEIFTSVSYDEKCDVWSVGVIAYILLCGMPPFLIYDDDELNFPFWIHVNKMDTRPVRSLEFPHKLWKDVSQHAKDFCTACLQIDPKSRARSTDLLNHPWFKIQQMTRRGSGDLVSPRSPLRHHHQLSMMNLISVTPKNTGATFDLPDILQSNDKTESAITSPDTSAKTTPHYQQDRTGFFDDPESENLDVVKF